MSNEIISRPRCYEGPLGYQQGNFISRLLRGYLRYSLVYLDGGLYAATANGLTMGYNIYAWFLLISDSRWFQLQLLSRSPNTIPCKKKSIVLPWFEVSGLYDCARTWLRLTLIPRNLWLADLSGVGDLINYAKSSMGLFDIPVYECYPWFFQGMNNLKPYAMSQIADRLSVLFGCLATFIIT